MIDYKNENNSKDHFNPSQTAIATYMYIYAELSINSNIADILS